MGPEDSDGFKIEPGRVWMVPVNDEGEPYGEPHQWNIGRVENLWLDEGGQEDDPGLDGGLEGRLDGGPEGPLAGFGAGPWSMEVEVSPEEALRWRAVLAGRTLEEYIDLARWVQQARWLRALTGLNWGSFE